MIRLYETPHYSREFVSMVRRMSIIRLQTRSKPKGDGGCERYTRPEVDGELAVAGGYAAKRALSEGFRLQIARLAAP